MPRAQRERTPATLRRATLQACLVMAGLAAMGCGFRNVIWKDRRSLPGHKLAARVPLIVDSNERLSATDRYGYIDTMLLTVQSDLRERGVEAEIVSPKPRSLPLPRIEISTRTIEQGDAAASAASNAFLWGVPVAGNGKFAASCVSVSHDNRVLFSGTVTAEQPGADARDLAEAVGHAIAEALTANQ
jgi:hypothetical protein